MICAGSDFHEKELDMYKLHLDTFHHANMTDYILIKIIIVVYMKTDGNK